MVRTKNKPVNPTYAITDWGEKHENAASRKVENCRWVSIYNQFDDVGIASFIDEGTDVYGCWCAILAVASRCKPRGTLIQPNGKPHTAKTLSLMTRMDFDAFQKALSIAVEVDLIEVLSGNHQPAPSALPDNHQTSGAVGKGRVLNGRETNTCASTSEIEESFVKFWTLYPKKQDKKIARRLWDKCHQHFDIIMAAIPKHIESKQWKDGFEPQPSKWLRNELWNNVINDTDVLSKSERILNEKQAENDAYFKKREAQHAAQ